MATSTAVRMHGRALILIAVLLAASWQPGTAQRPSPALDPAGTVRAFWAAVHGMRWAEAVGYLDLQDLENTRRRQLESAAGTRLRELTVSDLMRRDPEMPREAAEYEVQRRERQRQLYPARPFFMFFGVDSAAHLQRMPAEELAMRWIQAHDPLFNLLEQRRVRQCPASPAIDSLVAVRRAIVYGSVAAGPDTAFVPFRAEWFPLPGIAAEIQEIRAPRMAELLQGPTGWRIRSIEPLLQGNGGFMSMEDCPAGRQGG